MRILTILMLKNIENHASAPNIFSYITKLIQNAISYADLESIYFIVTIAASLCGTSSIILCARKQLKIKIRCTADEKLIELRISNHGSCIKTITKIYLKYCGLDTEYKESTPITIERNQNRLISIALSKEILETLEYSNLAKLRKLYIFITDDGGTQSKKSILGYSFYIKCKKRKKRKRKEKFKKIKGIQLHNNLIRKKSRNIFKKNMKKVEQEYRNFYKYKKNRFLIDNNTFEDLDILFIEIHTNKELFNRLYCYFDEYINSVQFEKNNYKDIKLFYEAVGKFSCYIQIRKNLLTKIDFKNKQNLKYLSAAVEADKTLKRDIEDFNKIKKLIEKI